MQSSRKTQGLHDKNKQKAMIWQSELIKWQNQ